MKFLEIWTRIMQVMLVVMAFLISIGALMRYVFNHPLHFIDEVAGVLLLSITFIGLAFVEKGGGHINIDTVYNLFPKKIQSVLSRVNWVIEILWAIIFLIIAAMTTLDYYNTQKRSMSTDWLLYPFAAIMVLGTAMLIIEFLVQKQSPLSFFRKKSSEPGSNGKEISTK